MQENTSQTLFKEKRLSCPLCNFSFHKEIIDNRFLKNFPVKENIELRQTYKKHPKLGIIIPLIYSVVVCPSCYYASFEQDLKPDNENIQQILTNNELNRKKLISSLFTREMNFKRKRNIEHGFLSYLLAIESYKLREQHNKIYSFKKALSTLRASWLAKDILEHYKESTFSIIYSILFRKAARYYGETFMAFQKEKINKTNFIGPDANNNWEYNGFLYTTGYLNYKLVEYDKDNTRKNKILNNVMKIMEKILEDNKNNNVLRNNAREIQALARKITEQD